MGLRASRGGVELLSFTMVKLKVQSTARACDFLRSRIFMTTAGATSEESL